MSTTSGAGPGGVWIPRRMKLISACEALTRTRHKFAVLAAVLAFLGAPTLARAETLHIAGPRAATDERRALAVLERDDGTCEPPGNYTLMPEDPSVTIAQGEVASDCARWFRVRWTGQPASIGIRAVSDQRLRARAQFVPPSNERLTVDASRDGGRVRVRVHEARAGDATEVWATTADGTVRLEREARGSFSGSLPELSAVLIVARLGDASGATAVAGAGRHGTLLASAVPALMAGGAPRTGAYLATFDASGRPSPHVALSVQSDDGTVRGLAWLRAGVAAVALAAPAGVREMNVTVRSGESEFARLQLAVRGVWTNPILFQAPPNVFAGEPLDLHVSSAHLDELLPALRVRCGSTVRALDRNGRAQCPTARRPASPSGETVELGYEIDGRFVPWFVRQVRRVEQATTLVRAPRNPVRRSVGWSVLANIGVNSWGGVGTGGGARVVLSPVRHFSIYAQGRYSVGWLDAQPFAPVLAPLRGTRHAVDLLVGVAGSISVGPVPLVARLGAGPAIQVDDVRFGNAPAGTSAIRVVASAALGSAVRIGPVDLIFDLGVRVAPLQSSVGWVTPPVTALLEVGIGQHVER